MNKFLGRRQFIQSASALAGLRLLVGQDAFAQGHPLRLLLGFPPGGPSDTVKLNRSVVVENKPGAASRLAMGEVKRSAPDGNTLIFSPAGAFSVLPNLYTAKNLGYVADDFAPVSRVAAFEYMLVAGNALNVSNLNELKTWLVKNPAQATLANPGTGTSPNLLGLVLSKMTGIPITQVSYKGTTPAIQDTMGGHISLCIVTPLEVREFHRSGKLKALASMSEKRSPLLPEVPTLTELGLAISADSFHGIWAPAGTPAEVVKTLNAAIVSVIAEPAVMEQFVKLGVHPAPSTPAQLLTAERADTKLWAGFIKETGIAITD